MSRCVIQIIWHKRFSDWLKRIDNTQLITLDSWKVYNNHHTVCGLHFENHYFAANNKLKNTAVPTLRIPYKPTSKNQLFHLQDEVIPSVSLQTPETPTLLQSRKFEPFKSGKKYCHLLPTNCISPC
ncbi:unnamed protein product [Tenebrio molitor]|nr:unnamed protein product [Tenebrio molitor]